jgi:hypothetical protein
MFRSFGLIRHIRSFHDLPLWAKVLVAPSAGIVAGVAIAVSIWLRDRDRGEIGRSRR